MCGISGIVHFDGTPVSRPVLRKMTRTLAHRGPDGEGFWLDGSVGFGHRRLAIRGLGDPGFQPMHDPTGQITVTYNGEIYNDRRLQPKITELTGIEFKTSCDTEILGPGFLAWGPQLADKLLGMFAFAIWDANHERLVLVRDPIGIKPLYYATLGNSIYFASEIKALLSVRELSAKLCPEGLHRFFAQGYPGPNRTTLQSIRPLPPGHVLIADRDGISITRYWRPARSATIKDERAALHSFTDLWSDVVNEMEVSEVPVGLLLSGGIDSALVAMELGGDDRYEAFTAGFSDETYDESQRAALMAKAADMQHRTALVDICDNQEAMFKNVVRHHDGQLGDSSALPFYLICKAARDFVPVLFTGDGADEFFAGYETYRASRIAHVTAPFLPRNIARLTARQLRWIGAAGKGPVPIKEKATRFLDGIASPGKELHPQWRRYLPAYLLRSCYSTEMRPLLNNDPLDEYGEAMADAGNVADRCLVGDQSYYLPGDLLVKSDTMSMAHGIEVRVPFLDRRIMEFAGSLDTRLLTPLFGPDKKLLRLAARERGVPSEITNGKKHGFNLPVSDILRHGLEKLGDHLLSRNADILEPYLNANSIRQMWCDHKEMKSDHGYFLWSLLSLAVWKRSISS